MKKEDIPDIAQLLSSIKDVIDKLEKAEIRKDVEGIASAKREILAFQKQVDSML